MKPVKQKQDVDLRDPWMVEDVQWLEVEDDNDSDMIVFDPMTDRIIDTVDTALFYTAKGAKAVAYVAAYSVAYVVKHVAVASWWCLKSVAVAVIDATRERPTPTTRRNKPRVNVTTNVNVTGDSDVNVHTEINVQ